MNWLQLYRIISRNTRLSYRRSPLLTQGQVAKVLMVISGIIFVGYLVLFGVLLGSAVDSQEGAMMVAFMPIVMIIDFFLRFMVQQTPLMQVKPYILLPISRYSVIEHFLVSSLNSVYNWLWLFLFVPYGIFALIKGCAVSEVIIVVLVCELLIMLNSQIYLMMRTLIARSLLWWLLAVVIYALPFLPYLIDWGKEGIERMFELITAFGGTVWMLLVVLLLIVGMLAINRRMQFAFVYEELARQEKTTLRRVWKLSFLDRFGQLGEYLKLEVKSVMRNKTVRSRFIMSLAFIVFFNLLIAFSSVYDGQFNKNFWCFYCFSLYSATSLTKVMGPEGNYIDLLMSHRENILRLLQAKYIFQSFMLLVPLILQIPAVITGKFSLLMLLAYMLLVSGMVHCIIFQVAVYNKETLPLNMKLTGKNNLEVGMQLVFELAAMFVPLIFAIILVSLLPETIAFIIIAAVGLVLTLATPWWMRNIYHRMMARKYNNLEGFHATRAS